MKEDIHLWATRVEDEKQYSLSPRDIGEEFQLVEPVQKVLNTVRNFRTMKAAHDGSEVRTGAYGDKSIKAIENLISVAETLKRHILEETQEFSSERLYVLDELLAMTDETKVKD